jgi:prepilin-type N-terminal cleavage/methylation domain-containing protein
MPTEILCKYEGPSDSESPAPRPSPGVPGEGVIRLRRGFTLLEMLTTVAALVIVLGLMVDLARYVRNDSSVKLTKQLLYQCDMLLAQYQLHHNGQLPAIAPFAYAEGNLDEATLQRRAIVNNREFVAALRSEAGNSSDLFGGLPDSIYNEATLSDAWGSPIVFMPSMHREIGIAPENHSFFFSAGPDRRYLTQDDNLYSYEEKSTGPVGK